MGMNKNLTKVSILHNATIIRHSIKKKKIERVFSIHLALLVCFEKCNLNINLHLISLEELSDLFDQKVYPPAGKLFLPLKKYRTS